MVSSIDMIYPESLEAIEKFAESRCSKTKRKRNGNMKIMIHATRCNEVDYMTFLSANNFQSKDFQLIIKTFQWKYFEVFFQILPC